MPSYIVVHDLYMLREVLGLTQRQLAHACGVILTTYMNWEQGKHNPSVPNMPRLARALHTSQRRLRDGDGS